MPALQKKHKKSSVHNIKSVMNTRYGAGGGTRTHTVLLPTDFESVTSANSITPANMFKFCTYISLTHFLNGFKRENHIILKI